MKIERDLSQKTEFASHGRLFAGWGSDDTHSFSTNKESTQAIVVLQNIRVDLEIELGSAHHDNTWQFGSSLCVESANRFNRFSNVYSVPFLFVIHQCQSSFDIQFQAHRRGVEVYEDAFHNAIAAAARPRGIYPDIVGMKKGCRVVLLVRVDLQLPVDKEEFVAALSFAGDKEMEEAVVRIVFYIENRTTAGISRHYSQCAVD